MALLYSPTSTATVAANTNSVTITGMDLNAVLAGMVINLGARDRLTGDGYIIASVTPTGTSGGTLTTVGTIPTAFNSAGFVVDTRDFNGTAPNYLIAMYTLVLTTLLRLTSPLTNLFSGSRVLALDKDSPGAISRLLYAIAGRLWLGAEQRTYSYTPSGGALTTAETFGLRAYPDGTTPSDAVLIDLTTGGVDVQATSSTMVAATTVDLASAPTMKVAITGGAQIASFGVGKHKVREVHFVDGGNVLVHNATSLILPTTANITTRAGDTLRCTSDAAGNWRVRSYDRADGTPLVSLGKPVRYDVAQTQSAAEVSQALGNLGVSTFIKTLLDDADVSTALSTLGVSAFIKTLLDDADASTALSTLGISTFIKTLLGNADAATARTTLGVFAITAFSLGANGYVKLSNGSVAFLIQWGAVTITNGDVGVTFPTAFSNTVWTVVPSAPSGPNSSTTIYVVEVDGYFSTSFAAHGRYASNGGTVGTAGISCNYIAIGPANP